MLKIFRIKGAGARRVAFPYVPNSKYWPAICCWLLLSGCVSSDLQLVRWHKVSDVQTFCASVVGDKAQGKFLHGCMWKTRDGICNIAAPDFKLETELFPAAVLGHELKHCFDGHWHK